MRYLGAALCLTDSKLLRASLVGVALAGTDACSRLEDPADGAMSIRDASSDGSSAEREDSSLDAAGEGPEITSRADAIDIAADSSREAGDPEVVVIAPEGGDGPKDVTQESTDVADASTSDRSDGLDGGYPTCPGDRIGGSACLVGGEACVITTGCFWGTHTHCVCSSNPGDWECFGYCGDSDAKTPCEAGSGEGSSEGSILVADTGDAVQILTARSGYLYWLSAQGSITRVPATGGPPEPLVTPGPTTPRAYAFALDDQSLYWQASGQVFAMPLGGGPVRLLTTTMGTGSALITDSNAPDVYLVDRGIAAVPKDGGPRRTISPLEPTLVGLIGADLYAVANATQPDSTGPWTTSAVGKISTAGGPFQGAAWMLWWTGAFATDGAELYLGQKVVDPSALDGIRRISVSGGEAARFYGAEWGFSLAWLGLDPQYVYFSVWLPQCKQQLRRMPRAGSAVTTVIDGLPAGQPAIATIGAGKLFWATGGPLRMIRALDL